MLNRMMQHLQKYHAPDRGVAQADIHESTLNTESNLTPPVALDVASLV